MLPLKPINNPNKNLKPKMNDNEAQDTKNIIDEIVKDLNSFVLIMIIRLLSIFVSFCFLDKISDTMVQTAYNA